MQQRISRCLMPIVALVLAFQCRVFAETLQLTTNNDNEYDPA
jgi:hypothetical protein